jgi:hypothetical protein
MIIHTQAKLLFVYIFSMLHFRLCTNQKSILEVLKKEEKQEKPLAIESETSTEKQATKDH